MTTQNEDYIKIANSIVTKFRLVYDQERRRFYFQINEGEVSKIDGMLLGNFDYIVTGSFFGDMTSGSGLALDKRLCDYDEGELKKIIDLVKRGKFFTGDFEQRAMRDAKNDVNSLREAERALYENGFRLPESKSHLELF